MKPYLLYKSQDFDFDATLPPGYQDLVRDLELSTLLQAMAAGDDGWPSTSAITVRTKRCSCGLSASPTGAAATSWPKRSPCPQATGRTSITSTASGWAKTSQPARYAEQPPAQPSAFPGLMKRPGESGVR